MYAGICYPLSIRGLFQSLMMSGSSTCGFMLNILKYTNNAYAAITAAMTSIVIAKMTQFFNVGNPENRENPNNRGNPLFA